MRDKILRCAEHKNCYLVLMVITTPRFAVLSLIGCLTLRIARPRLLFPAKAVPLSKLSVPNLSATRHVIARLDRSVRSFG